MPRNGSGVYSLPAGSTFSPNTLIQSSVVNGINNDIATDMNTPRPIVAGGTGSAVKNFDDLVVYASKAGNYTAVLADNNAVHRYTATATVALTTSGTLGSGWHYTIIADGADVTIDPNASETINGFTTITVPNGSTAKIVCDGTNFYTIMKPIGWEIIPGGHVVSAGVTAVSFTNLGSYRRLWVVGSVTPGSASGVYFRTSTDNGISYSSSATDYTYQNLGAANASPYASRTTASALPITPTSVTFVGFSSIVDDFNSSTTGCFVNTTAQIFVSANMQVEVNTGVRGVAVARNAIQITLGGGTFSCNVTVHGMRG